MNYSENNEELKKNSIDEVKLKKNDALKLDENNSVNINKKFKFNPTFENQKKIKVEDVSSDESDNCVEKDSVKWQSGENSCLKIKNEFHSSDIFVENGLAGPKKVVNGSDERFNADNMIVKVEQENENHNCNKKSSFNSTATKRQSDNNCLNTENELFVYDGISTDDKLSAQFPQKESINIKNEVNDSSGSHDVKSTSQCKVKSYPDLGEKRNHCEFCSYRCNKKSRLLLHMKIHTGEKDQHCAHCDFRTYYKCNLVEHMKTHTGEKSFNCPHCFRSFSVRSNLKKHIKIHTGEKIHQCSYCSYSFTQKDNLVRHLKTHTGEKDHNCPKCSLSFAQKCNLVQHMKTHLGIKEHQCPLCDYKFTRKSSVSIHIQRKHSALQKSQC